MAESPQTPPDAPADAPGAAGTTVVPTGPAPAGPTSIQDVVRSPIFWIVIVAWVLVIRSFMGQRKKDRARKEELASVKKGDRVQTIDRMYGTVTGLSQETVTIKPDEKSNFTMTFDRAAVWKVLPRGGRDGNGTESD
jgi:preprotein translocase subunit YajC